MDAVGAVSLTTGEHTGTLRQTGGGRNGGTLTNRRRPSPLLPARHRRRHRPPLRQDEETDGNTRHKTRGKPQTRPGRLRGSRRLPWWGNGHRVWSRGAQKGRPTSVAPTPLTGLVTAHSRGGLRRVRAGCLLLLFIRTSLPERAVGVRPWVRAPGE